MRTIIPSYNRHETIRTHKLFPPDSTTIVLSNQEQFDLYSKNDSLEGYNIVVSGIVGNLAKKRQWILDNLVEEDEWITMADDNIRKYRCISMPWYDMPELDEEGITKEVDISSAQGLAVFAETLHEADKRGAKFCGFRSNSNPFFGRRKWSDVSYISTKLCLIKKDSRIKFDPEFPMRDEVLFTAEHLKLFGRVLVNKYLFPGAPHYEKGGLGSLDSRLQRRREECLKLMDKYPNLFRWKKNKSTPEGSDIQLRLHSVKQVEQWKQQMENQLSLFPEI
jgi:hypothetical protein|tara:strand:- start:15578 stop:16411 length:834 start_codon:yes stop_codon:yes gene_type:complete